MPAAWPRAVAARRLTQPLATAWAAKKPAVTSTSPASTEGRESGTVSSTATIASRTEPASTTRAPRRSASRPASAEAAVPAR